jgi:hypothetical protein
MRLAAECVHPHPVSGAAAEVLRYNPVKALAYKQELSSW